MAAYQDLNVDDSLTRKMKLAKTWIEDRRNKFPCLKISNPSSFQSAVSLALDRLVISRKVEPSTDVAIDDEELSQLQAIFEDEQTLADAIVPLLGFGQGTTGYAGLARTTVLQFARNALKESIQK